jgi:hypothetical protein
MAFEPGQPKDYWCVVGQVRNKEQTVFVMASYGDWEDNVFRDYVGRFAICEEKGAGIRCRLCR